MSLAPEPVLRAALKVLFVGGCATRNWTIHRDAPREKINSLWEALHEIPDLLGRWRVDSEQELISYLDEYDTQWSDLALRAVYDDARDRASNPGVA